MPLRLNNSAWYVKNEQYIYNSKNQKEILKYPQKTENENTTYQKLWDAAKGVL